MEVVAHFARDTGVQELIFEGDSVSLECFIWEDWNTRMLSVEPVCGCKSFDELRFLKHKA